jgi:hypothetical protein
MISFQEYLDAHNTKYIDFDKNRKFWCVDNMRQYIQDVLGLSGWVLPAAPNAKTIYNNYSSTRPFTKIKNTAYNIPKSGDIIFWGYYPFVTGLAGHVGIVVGDGGSVNNFISFDQNYPTGTACHRQLHSYKGVMGWLRKV